MKRVLVTGVSRGLGLAIAQRLVADGYAVTGYGRTEGGFAALREAAPDRAVYHALDLDDPGAVAEAARRASKEGPIWGLVNNAAIGQPGLLATQHTADIERMMRVNLLAPITFCKFVARGMLARREGRIVNISSIIAVTGFHGLSVYGATKAGIEGFSRSLARELGKAGVTVNCVAPGYLETEITRGFTPEQVESIRRRAPLGFATPADAAAAVAYFLGPDAARTTGTVLKVDGGSTA